MMERKEVIGKLLENIANISVQSASIFCFYEPKVPEQLVKKNLKKKTK